MNQTTFRLSGMLISVRKTSDFSFGATRLPKISYRHPRSCLSSGLTFNY